MEYLFCKLHEVDYLNNHERGHVCIACTLDEGVCNVERFLSGIKNEKIENDFDANYMFTTYFLLLYLTVEKLHTIFKFIGITLDFVEKQWPVLIEIRKWANFIKHPKGFMFTHHPKFIFEDEFENENASATKTQYIDYSFIKKFYSNENDEKFKQNILQIANKENIAVLIPKPERIAKEFTKVCSDFCNKIKENEHFQFVLKDMVILNLED